jgi:bacteriocin-like protein
MVPFPTNQERQVNNEINELTIDELENVSGGSFWSRVEKMADNSSALDFIASHAQLPDKGSPATW